MAAAFSRRAVALALAALVCSACGAASPVAPTAAPLTASLTVRVVSYADQTSPIAGALVAVDDFHAFRVVQKTDARGVLTVDVPIGVDLTVRAGATGYLSFAASGTLKAAETWTFYLFDAPGE